MLVTGLGRVRNKGEASVLHIPALAFPRKDTHSPALAGADLQSNVVEGVHVGSTSQEPLIQNDHEDEVDARQKVQPHIRQEEGQVEALWVQVEGKAEPGTSGGQEGRLPSGPVASVLGDAEEGEGWQAWIKSQHPTGLPDSEIWGTPSPYPIPAPQTLWVSPLPSLLSIGNAILPSRTWGLLGTTVHSSAWIRVTHSWDLIRPPNGLPE